MRIVYKKIDELIPYENNPRHNRRAVEAVAESIKEFGFRVPIIIDKNNTIIAGHTRLMAARRLLLTEVPCIVANDLTEEQVLAFRIVDNRAAEYSEWDYQRLERELAQIGNSIDISMFGFQKSSKEREESEYKELRLVVTAEEFQTLEKVYEAIGGDRPEADIIRRLEDHGY